MPTFGPGWNRLPRGGLVISRVVTVLVHPVIFHTFRQRFVAALWRDGVGLWGFLQRIDQTF